MKNKFTPQYCTNCGKPIKGLAVAMPTTEPKKRNRCMECAKIDKPLNIQYFEKVCNSKYATRPILYTDIIDGKQVCRDDMWAVTTKELNQVEREAKAEVAKVYDEAIVAYFHNDNIFTINNPKLLSPTETKLKTNLT